MIFVTSLVFQSICLSSWRKDYLEHIKIIIDQASLNLILAHNEKREKRLKKNNRVNEKREYNQERYRIYYLFSQK
ncbi:unnamed protein product [Spirodela intermedia]|uniref:Uncharacterized protein n=1 Tax=Spirodela intermedia TaxID=51605 RepID=A0A7I8IYL9_SPIIN|nr:unnamed protein product [Spirodela intermedia]CAA6662233.1 unnamed protein product [Spirodela intermedia]